MKKLNNIEELDALFKSKLQSAKVDPPADVWSSVSSSIGANSGSVISQMTQYFSSLTNIVKVALFVGGVSTIGLILYQANKPEENKQNSVTQNDQSGNSDNAFNKTDVIGSTEDDKSQAIDGKGQGPSSQQTGQGESEINTEQGSEPLVLGGESGSEESTDPRNQQRERETIQVPTIYTITACIHETRDFRFTSSVDWYVDDVLVLRNSRTLEHKFHKSGEHRVTCSNRESKNIWIVNVIELRATISYRILERNRYAFTASTSYGTSLSWIINSREVSTATQFEHELTTGEHTVVLIATSGECVTRSAEKIVVKELQEYKELEFYQSFSPNADGINDSYLAPEAEYVEFRMTVKDQNGRIVFETSNPNHGWNGKVNGVGDGCPAASYNVEFVYKLKGEAKARRDIVPIRLFRD